MTASKSKNTKPQIPAHVLHILKNWVKAEIVESVEEGLDMLLCHYVDTAMIEDQAVELGAIAVDSGQILISDLRSDLKLPEDELIEQGQIKNEYGVGAAVAIDTCMDGFYAVMLEDWGDHYRVTIDIPKLDFGSDADSNENE